MGNQNATSLTFNETVSGLGRLVVGTYYDTHATSVTLNKALPDGMTLGGLTLRNTGKGNAATGVTTVTAAQDTLRGAAVSFDFGHGSTQPNVSWLKVMGNNTIASLTATAGGNLFLAQGVTLEAQEAHIAGDFALDGDGTLKARSLAVSGTLRNAAHAAIETTEGLTVKDGGTLVYEGGRPLKGNLLCEAGATVRLSNLRLTLEGGTLSASGATTLVLPAGAAEGDLLVACTDATDATAALLATGNNDLKVVATAEGYRLAKNVTLQTADGSALPQVEDLLAVAYDAGIRGAVTVAAQTSGGGEPKGAVADLLACFTGLTATADADAATLTVVCDFGITRAMAKAVEGHEGRCLVVEAQVRTGEGGTATFAEGTAVTLTLDPVPEADIVEVTDWSAATPGAAQGNARYFRLPLKALTPTTKLKVRATKP